MILRMLQQGKAGRVAEARETVRVYLRENPTDAEMYYNLACIDIMLGEKDQALADLEEAFEQGFTNFRIFESDRDIKPLLEDPRLVQMILKAEEKFRKVCQSRTLYLDEGYMSDVMPLGSAPGTAVDSELLHPEISVGFSSEALQVHLSVEDPGCQGDAPPWQGGCGVLVNLVHPMSPDDYESRRYFSLGFYSLDGQPKAALVGKHGKVLLEPRNEIEPVITREGSQTTFRITIPWEEFSPYAPPLDQEMGLNVFYLGSGQGSSRQVFSLMNEESLSFSTSPWRRYIPVFFLTSDRTVPVMRGGLYQRLAQGDSLGVQLALWSETEGDTRCRMTIQPRADASVVVGEPMDMTFPCERELNFFNTYLPLVEIPSGSYNLVVEVTGPDGITFTQEFPFDNLVTDWISSLNERVYALKTPEQSILYYHLFILARMLNGLDPQDDASHLHQARAEVVRLIELCEAGGSCLPESGLFRGGFTTEAMTQRYCSMYLPEGYRKWEQPDLLVVLPAEPGSEDNLARNLGQALEGKSEVVVLVPQSYGHSSLAREKSANETGLALQWALGLFPESSITLVGLGMSSDAALESSLSRPELCTEVLLEGAQLFGDLQNFSEDGVMGLLGDRGNNLPYFLASGASVSPRFRVVYSGMKKLELDVTALSFPEPGMTVSNLAAWYLARH